MTSDMKADTAQLKEPKQAKLQTPKKQHFPPTEAAPKETGGPRELEPTRDGDRESHGRCTEY